jgi:hypothetical protein
MNKWIVLKTISKFYIKIYIKTAPTRFGVITIIRENTIRVCWSYSRQISQLNLILLKWSIGCAPNNASIWQMGFNSAFKGLKYIGVVNLVVWLRVLTGPCWCMSAVLFRTVQFPNHLNSVTFSKVFLPLTLSWYFVLHFFSRGTQFSHKLLLENPAHYWQISFRQIINTISVVHAHWYCPINFTLWMISERIPSNNLLTGRSKR